MANLFLKVSKIPLLDSPALLFLSRQVAKIRPPKNNTLNPEFPKKFKKPEPEVA
jgi:hypothetical protein